MGILVRISVAMTKKNDQNKLGEKEFINSHHWAKSEQELVDRNEAGAMEGHCFMACYLWLVQPGFLFPRPSAKSGLIP